MKNEAQAEELGRRLGQLVINELVELEAQDDILFIEKVLESLKNRVESELALEFGSSLKSYQKGESYKGYN